ncbi:MAG: hypothetical protein D6723_05880 [Acidobacteria bacterium]|nr:MAG: hypothetical protein D6723_05880 [Acidobacteriota bacterium]
MKRTIFNSLLTVLIVLASTPAYAGGEPGGGNAPAIPPSSTNAPASSSATVSADEAVNILIVYFSMTGNTEKMATGVQEGVERVAGATVTLKKVDEVTNDDLAAADGIVLGSPTYWGTIATPMKNFLDITGFWGGKVGGAFSTGALETGGKESVVVSLLLALMMKGVIVVGPVYDFGNFQAGSLGASAMTGPPDEGVSDSELEEARKLGERVATITQQLKRGSP